MIFYQISFGPYSKNNYEEAKELVEGYLSALVQNGQIDENYSIVPRQEQIVAYIDALGLKANHLPFHSEMGKENLKLIGELFGRTPVWTCNEDFPPKKNVSWKNASFLCCVTSMFDRESPIWRGDKGLIIPYFTLPITDQDKETIYFWTSRYRDHDRIWLDSHDLSMPAYRLLAEPDSSLSIEGRRCCSVIEKATGIPTYYYLTRYYGREVAEEKQRRCPGCGKPWLAEHPEKKFGDVFGEVLTFWKFDFMCKKCRLVSHGAPNVNLRYAKIGEPRKNPRSLPQSPPRKQGEQ